MKKIIVLILASVISIAAFAEGEYGMSKDIINVASENGSFTTFVAAIEAAGLVETLQGMGPFTVFAPTDEAFGKLPAGTVEALLSDIPTLKNILLYQG